MYTRIQTRVNYKEDNPFTDDYVAHVMYFSIAGFTRYLGGLEQTNGNAVVIYVDLETLREEGYYTNFESLLTIRNDLMINMGYPISTQRRAGR